MDGNLPFPPAGLEVCIPPNGDVRGRDLLCPLNVDSSRRLDELARLLSIPTNVRRSRSTVLLERDLANNCTP
jgi:hypothetical protein